MGPGSGSAFRTVADTQWVLNVSVPTDANTISVGLGIISISAIVQGLVLKKAANLTLTKPRIPSPTSVFDLLC